MVVEYKELRIQSATFIAMGMNLVETALKLDF